MTLFIAAALLLSLLAAAFVALPLLRAVIETRKDQFLRIPWEIQLKDENADDPTGDPRCKEVKEFFKKPDNVVPTRVGGNRIPVP